MRVRWPVLRCGLSDSPGRKVNLDQDQRFRLISQIIDGTIVLCRTGIIVIAFILIAYYLQNVLVAFSGKQTEASLSFSIITKLQVDRWFAYLFGAGGVGYGLVQQRLRQRNIRRLTAHTEVLERQMHPGRTSSGLTPAGKTRREDR